MKKRYRHSKPPANPKVLETQLLVNTVPFSIFGPDERGPHSDLKLKFEAIEAMAADDQAVIVSLIDAYIKKQRLEELAAS